MPATRLRTSHVSDTRQRERLAITAERLADPLSTLAVGGEPALIPDVARQAVADVIARLSRGETVVVSSHTDLLTTSQAADQLGISRTYLLRLLAGGKIPYTMRGTHKRIKIEDLLAYRRRQSEQRSAALDQVARVSREAGLYEDDF